MGYIEIEYYYKGFPQCTVRLSNMFIRVLIYVAANLIEMGLTLSKICGVGRGTAFVVT